MTIRQARAEELSEIMAVFAQAQAFMRDTGNPRQWEDYPTREIVLGDIARGECWVLETGGELAGVFALGYGRDEEYELPEAGFSEGPYATLHRVASSGRAKGVFAAALDFCRARTDCLRVDTHEDNHIMRRLLERAGFRRCGTLQRFGERFLTYEWKAEK
ncbi:MAG: GNAT family N-acetyltransferase [Oscillospiraceae bacterium]